MKRIRARADGTHTEKRGGTFTGDVFADSILNQDGVVVNTVNFLPGSRTFWHRHAGGQFLHVHSGEGLVVPRDSRGQRVAPGDHVWAPPGEEHWHGAYGDTLLTHTAVSIGQTEWLEEVTAADYESACATTAQEEGTL